MQSKTFTASLMNCSYLFATFSSGLFTLLNKFLYNSWISEEPLWVHKRKWFFLVCQGKSYQVNISFLDFPLLRNDLRKAAKDIMLQQALRSDNQVKHIKRIKQPSKYHGVTASTTSTTGRTTSKHSQCSVTFWEKYQQVNNTNSAGFPGKALFTRNIN